MANCVFCDTTDDITVTMNVKTDLGDQVVYICSGHEDDASPKKVRELVQARVDRIKKLEEEASKLGYVLVAKDAEKKIDPATEAARAAAIPKPAKQPAKQREIITPGAAGIQAHKSHEVEPIELRDGSKVAAPVILEHEEQIIAGREGMPVTVPKRITDESGETTIKIVKIGDEVLQQRHNPNTSFQGGYTSEAQTRRCTFCNATGVTKINGKMCPKCEGTGQIN